MKKTDITMITETFPNAVFSVRTGRHNQLMIIEQILSETNAQGNLITYAVGHAVRIDESNDFSVKHLHQIKVTTPYVKDIAFNSPIEMRANAMAIDAQAKYTQYNY